MSRLFIFFIFWVNIICSFGQDTLRKKHESLFADTGLTSSDYVTYMERSIQRLSAIRSSCKLGFKVMNIRNDLPLTDTTIKIVKESLKYGKHLDVRDLQMFQILTTDVQKKLNSYKKAVDSAGHRASNATENMRAMRGDTIWRELKKDTAAKRAFNTQLTELRKRWKITDSTLRTNIKILDELTIHITNNAIINTELRDQIEGQINKLSQQSITKEQHYLWERKPAENTTAEIENSADTYYRGEREAVSFYIRESSSVRILMLVLGVLFYYWINRNFRQLAERQKDGSLKDLNILYLSKHPVIPTIIVVLNLSPLFDLTPPAVFITFMQFLLMLVLILIFYSKWPRPVFFKWATIVLFYLLLLSTHLISSSSVVVRYWFLALTIGSVIFGGIFLREQIKTKEFPVYVSWVTGMFILFNFLAVIFNISGRWTLTQLFATSAVFGLAQIIGLSIFIQIIVEAFTINILNARLLNDLSEDFDFQPFIENIKKAFTYLSIVLWIMVLASNLNIYNFLYDRTLLLLTTQRNVGSISFNIGSILLFFIIIWVSGVLQKYISYLFGDSGAEISKVNKKQHSKLLLIRLVLLTAGFFLAVAASGLPVDKITIILGALGVGIGLGLQNIVNNFVSGVILIFERPFQVGDSIEIGARKGKVKEIGIRHSILLTVEGGEVIVPNGDMLSNQIMNWTLSNNYIRIEIPLKIEATDKWNTISEKITKMIEEDERVLSLREPMIVLNTINANILDFKIFVWCKDFYEAENLKSDLVRLLYDTLKAENIELK